MPPETNPDPNTVSDEMSFLVFVRMLEADRRLAAALEEIQSGKDDASEGWQNGTIEQFLESAVAWAHDSDFGRHQGLGDDVSAWRRFAAFLYAGKIYE